MVKGWLQRAPASNAAGEPIHHGPDGIMTGIWPRPSGGGRRTPKPYPPPSRTTERPMTPQHRHRLSVLLHPPSPTSIPALGPRRLVRPLRGFLAAHRPRQMGAPLVRGGRDPACPRSARTFFSVTYGAGRLRRASGSTTPWAPQQETGASPCAHYSPESARAATQGEILNDIAPAYWRSRHPPYIVAAADRGDPPGGDGDQVRTCPGPAGTHQCRRVVAHG